MKDIGRLGRHLWAREAWSLRPQSNLPDQCWSLSGCATSPLRGDAKTWAALNLAASSTDLVTTSLVG
jgi:hypothetical protein